MSKYIINYSNGKTEEKEFSPTENFYFQLERNSESFDKIESVSVPLCENIPAGTDGFYIMPGACWRAKILDTGMSRFKEHGDIDYINYDTHIPIFAFNRSGKAQLYITEGMKEIVCQRIKIKDNCYSLYLFFEINNEIPYDDISIVLYNIDGEGTYSDIAKKYREYCFSNGFVRITNRLNKELKYAAESIMVRVRMGWKPVPCEILEQTEENEPPVHVACTFKDVESLMYDYKSAGIDKAEFCLVGWNKGGHDGRWPQILPAEESLGGEEDLRHLIKTAEKLGYMVSCHTNNTDGYTLAKNFTEDDIALKKDGTKSIEAETWGGGRTYNICPKRALEISRQTLPEVANLGFRGTHYIDVITATPPRNCYNPNHPVNKKEGVAYLDGVLKLAQELFGAAGSECSIVHNMKYCDFVLYNTFRSTISHNRTDDEFDLVDTYIPFWQIAFHGTVMYTPSATTVNAIFNDDKDAMLKVIEYGGRPTVYFYSKFKSDGTDWIGKKDFTLDTPELTAESVEGSKKTYDIYNELSYLQYELIENHRELVENVFETTYSDGSVVTVDYNNKNYTLKRGLNK